MPAPPNETTVEADTRKRKAAAAYYRVDYFNRYKRVRYCRRIDDQGRFIDGLDQLCISNGRESYALDRYGILYSITAEGTDIAEFINHSTFNAGKPVVCAGMLLFGANGKLASIDNGSGHYRPDINNLAALVQTLQVQGADLTVTCVSLIWYPSRSANGFQPQRRRVRWKASTFLQYATAPTAPQNQPDWTAQDTKNAGFVEKDGIFPNDETDPAYPQVPIPQAKVTWGQRDLPTPPT